MAQESLMNTSFWAVYLPRRLYKRGRGLSMLDKIGLHGSQVAEVSLKVLCLLAWSGRVCPEP